MKKRRLRTIGSKMTVLFVLCALVLSAALSVSNYLSSWREYTDFFSQKAEEMVAIIAANVDGDKIGQYLKTGETDEYYAELEGFLRSVKREQKIEYLYLFEPGEHELTYILEAALETDDLSYISKMGDTYAYTDIEYDYLVPDVQAKRASKEKIISYGSEYGPGVSAWAPVFASDGRLVAMVEADYSLEMVTSTLRGNMLESTSISLGLIAVMIIALSLVFRKVVTRPLATLTSNARNFAGDNALSEFPDDIHTGDEMQTLSEAFGQMAKDIAQYTKRVEAVAADKERIATELSLGKDIQLSLLPHKFPAFPNRSEFDLYAQIQPAKVAGGDFYDFFLIDSKRLCIVVGGVQGQGLPAALFMVVAKTIIKNQMMTGLAVEEAMTVINERLYESSSIGVAVSAFVGVLEIAGGKFSYVNAGGDAPLFMRKDGSYDLLAAPAMTPLAEVEHVTYRAMEQQLHQGDRLVVYSSGTVRVQNPRGQLFGAESLRAFLNKTRSTIADPKAAVRTICDEIAVFGEDAEQQWDVTVLALEYCKGNRARAEISVRAREDSFSLVQRFLKRQLEENGIGGSKYAVLSLAAEEAFALITAQLSGHSEVTVRCSVAEAEGKVVTISLSYAGNRSNPLEEVGVARDAVTFMRRSMDDVNYEYAEGINSVNLVKRA